ncbi:MAG: NAD(P)H-hydrate dehydratase [Anaerolineae bacterium]
MRIVSTVEMRTLEKRTDENGHSYAAMMELAGGAVARVIMKRLPPQAGRMLVIVGPGNNGGDGLVAARYLHQQGYTVSCYALRPRAADDPNLVKLLDLGITLQTAEDDPEYSSLRQILPGCAAIIDALFGTGMQGPLRGNAPAILHNIKSYLEILEPSELPQITSFTSTTRASKPLVVAVDIPSGVDSDSGTADDDTLKADITVTFGYPKYGHYRFPGASLVGELLVADIGLVSLADDVTRPSVATPAMVKRWLPERPLGSNKGTFGSALVVGGSVNYSGAPRLAAEAAYRAGAGLVTLAVPTLVYANAAAQLPDTTFLYQSDSPDKLTPHAVTVINPELPRYASLLVGPGLGMAPETRDFLEALLGNVNGHSENIKLPPTVIDADGLNLLSQFREWWKMLPDGCILTPHPGEMARLVGSSVRQVQSDRWALARESALRWHCTVVLKGAFTVIASPDGEVIIMPFANPLLAAAGTGDVLAGTILGLLAQKVPSFQAAVCGAFIHGLAGELRRQEIGNSGLLAHDLLPLIARAASSIRQE